MTKPKALIVVSEDWYFLSHRLPLAKRLQKEGIEVHVACRIDKCEAEIKKHGFILQPINFQRQGISPSVGFKVIRALRALYKKEKYDLIIHVALFTVFLGSIASLFVPKTKVLNLITGLGYTFISQNLKARLIRSVISITFRLLANLSHIYMLVQNSDDQQQIERFGFRRDETLFLVPGSGVDAEHFYPAIEEPDPPVITFVGRLLWAKGISELIEAARLVKSRNVDCRFVFIGDIDDANPQSASAEDITKWEQEEIAEFWGRREDIAEIYRNSSIAILPSWREGLPKSLLEGAACGLAMIATDVPGCREIVNHEENGLLVEARNPYALAQAIEKLVCNPKLRQHYGQNARHLIETTLNDHAIMNKTISVIRFILQPK